MVKLTLILLINIFNSIFSLLSHDFSVVVIEIHSQKSSKALSLLVTKLYLSRIVSESD